MACGLLSGCALPLPISVATWVLDGVVFVSTDKSITGHALSSVMEQDCKLLRGLQGEDICIDDVDDVTVAVAQAGQAEAYENFANTNPQIASNFMDGFGSLKGEKTPLIPIVEKQPQQQQPAITGDLEENDIAWTSTDYTDFPKSDGAQGSKSAAIPVVVADVSEDALLYVIGSFYKTDDAKRFSTKYHTLETNVRMAKIGQRTVHRVVVGPFDRKNRLTMKKTIQKAGIKDAWAIKARHPGWQNEELESADISRQ